MPELKVAPLKASQIAEAYPLVRSAVGLTLPQWDSLARRLGSSVLAAVDEGTRVHGIASYRLVQELRRRPTLVVELVATFELTRRARVREALRAALERIASAEKCSAMIVEQLSGQSGTASIQPGS